MRDHQLKATAQRWQTHKELLGLQGYYLARQILVCVNCVRQK